MSENAASEEAPPPAPLADSGASVELCESRWNGRVALVTGANSGIGAAITRQLLQLGMVVVAVDIEVYAVQELALREPRLRTVVCDVSMEEDVVSTFRYVEETLGGVDVLVNNAGVSGFSSLLDGSPSEWRRLLDVNVVALCLCTREAVSSMRRRQLRDGQVVFISSNTAHHVPKMSALHFYTATKHAVRALAEGYRQELAGSGIRVTTVSPGLVRSAIFRSSLGATAERQVYQHPAMQPADVAAAVANAITAPNHVQMNDLVIKPVGSLA